MTDKTEVAMTDRPIAPPNYFTMDASDGNYMVINGVRYPVINSWVESHGEGRRRWGIVTEGEETGLPYGECGCHAMDGSPLSQTGPVARGHIAGEQPAAPIDDCPGGDSCPGHATADRLPLRTTEGYGHAPKAEFTFGTASMMSVIFDGETPG